MDPSDDALSATLRQLLQAQNHTEAVAFAETWVTRNPQSPVAWSGLADAWAAAGRPDIALEGRRQALALAPHAVALAYNLGTTLLAHGDHDEAAAVLEQVVRAAPQAPLPRINLGVARRNIGQLGPSATVLREALQLAKPGSVDQSSAEWNLALTLLMGGDIRGGLPAYESRLKLPDFSMVVPEGLPRWTGKPVDGRLLVVAEQGLGDTLQYARFLRRLNGRGVHVLLAVQPPLAPLLRESLDAPHTEVVPLARDLSASRCRAWAPLLSLPFLLGIQRQDQLLESTPWLAAPAPRVEAWSKRLAQLPGPFRIGVVWQGNPSYGDDKHRSVPLRHFAPLATESGFSLVSLQKRHGRDQLASLPQGMQVVDLDDELDQTTGPFLDTAAAMTALDAVVTSDTATLHLSGALGVPTWAAIAHRPDWRFGLQGARLPEYPEVRLVRQTQAGDWPGVIQSILTQLRRFRDHSSPRSPRT